MSDEEAISLMIGQCGVQLGSACWNLYGVEHEISPEGIFVGAPSSEDNSVSSFYRESFRSRYVPRTLFIDLEPSVIDEIRTGPARNLFYSECLINSNQDSSNNFARGLYTCGRLLVNKIAVSTLKQVEACNSLRCFIVHHAYAGGTGSGLMSIVLDHLMSEYPKITKLDLGLIPNDTLASSTVEPYNTILGMHHPMESTDLAMLYENEPLYEICRIKLNQKMPTFPHLNEIVSQLMSGLTACTRFDSPLGCGLLDIQTNIVPYPRIHFPLVSFAPIGSPVKSIKTVFSTMEVTKAAFDESNQMVSINANEGKIMACNLIYRGPVSPQDSFNAMDFMKKCKNIEWVDWCPTGFKVGISGHPLSIPRQNLMGYANRSVTLLRNTTAVRTVFNNLCEKFSKLYSKKAFIHWFIVEGMEEKEFQDAYDDIVILSSDYELLEKASDEANDGNKPQTEAGESNANQYNSLNDDICKSSESFITNSCISSDLKNDSWKSEV